MACELHVVDVSGKQSWTLLGQPKDQEELVDRVHTL